jgi:murein DD-endopeptidase MepM/ murein hydrolase activator NlpD
LKSKCKLIDKKTIVLLAALLLIAASTAPVQAQEEEPLPTTVHAVERGETLLSIAQEYGTTVNAITHANGITDPRNIYVGQSLVIPAGGVETGTMEVVPYVVQAGDTVSSIARRYGTTWQTLVHINALLSPNSIYPGLVIQVPRVTPASETRVAFPRTTGGLIYAVRPDDTLRRIALRYDISPWTLAANNDPTRLTLIYPGRDLIVPGEGTGPLPAPFRAIEVQPLPVPQGTTMVVAVYTTEPVKLQGRLFDRDVYFAEERGVYYGMVGVYVFTEPGMYELTLTAQDGDGHNTSLTTEIIVAAGRFGYERIDLPADRTSLLDPAVIAAERGRLDSIRYAFTPDRRWTTPLQRPCIGTITAYYGTHRAYNDGPYTSYHSGVDFRAPGGTPVYAPAAGTIVMAEPLTVRGNVVFIDHGWGILTGYWHLSSIEVAVGQYVEQGDLIARVGNTGLSTGAHLHWEMWIGGISVDALQWLEESFPWPGSEGLATGG